MARTTNDQGADLMVISQPRHARWFRWLGLGLAALAIGIAPGSLVQSDLRVAPARLLDAEGASIPAVVAVSSCETAPDSSEPEWVPTGLGRAYDRAATRMIRINHELECRQADLARLRRLGAPGWAIARVDRAVQHLENDYARAIEAITHERG